jgi:CelD/BcsL family acetyltransferase involved in cellulose biosynthesis
LSPTRSARRARARSSELPLSFELVDSLDQLRDDWIRLADESDNLFATWEWMSTWWDCLGIEGAERVATCRTEDGRLLAIVPLHRQIVRGFPILRFFGHGPGDELGPVCAPENRGRVAHALRQFLTERFDDWSLFLGENLPGSEDWSVLLAGSPLVHGASPVIRWSKGGWDGYLASRSPNFRQQVRRRERNVFRRHDARYRLVTGSDRLQSELDILFRLHRARWGRDQTGFTTYEGFHRRFAELAQERGWLRLWFLEFAREPVAAWYGFRFADVEYYYQAGRDPQELQEPVGFVLLAHTVKAAIEDGVREYRLLDGPEPYKYRFATEDPGLQTVALARALPGQAALRFGSSILRSSAVRALAVRQLSRG